MRRFSISLVLVLAVLSLLAAAAPAQAQERPLRGGGMGSLNQSFNFNSAELFGPARLTLLGRSGVNIELDTYWLDFVFENPFPVPVFGRVLIVSRSGNLVASLDGEFDPATGIMAGTLTFQGGSGRFDGVTGSASLLIVFDDWTGPFGNPWFDFAIEGTIDY